MRRRSRGAKKRGRELSQDRGERQKRIAVLGWEVCSAVKEKMGEHCREGDQATEGEDHHAFRKGRLLGLVQLLAKRKTDTQSLLRGKKKRARLPKGQRSQFFRGRGRTQVYKRKKPWTEGAEGAAKALRLKKGGRGRWGENIL